jgi:hypothetical protein
MLALRCCVLLIVMKIATRTPEPYCRMFEGKKGGNEEANKKSLGGSQSVEKAASSTLFTVPM